MVSNPLVHDRIGSPSIARILRYVEWTVLVVILVIVLFDPGFTAWHFLPTWTVFLFLAAFAGLSVIFPIDCPVWQRRAYVLVEALLVLASQFAGFNFDILLHLLIAKSCFLLSRRDVAITVGSLGLLWLPLQISLIPKVFEFVQHYYQVSQNSGKLILSSAINYTGSYIIASTFVLLFSYAIVAERKSRQRAETLTQEVETLAATLERTRIAQEIHDSLGHTLTTLDIQLEVAQKLRQRDPEKALQALDTAKQLASQSLQDVRHALQTMRSSTVNLNEAAIALVEQVRQNQAFTIHADLNLPSLPLQMSHQLYCILKEALMNVQKHAQASQVQVYGHSTMEQIHLQITDNGIGFDPHQPYCGFGLRGMQERVAIMGGRMQIKSGFAQGTTISIAIDLTGKLGEGGSMAEVESCPLRAIVQ